MDWKKLLGSITESVDEEIRLRNASLGAENRILRQQISGRVHLSDSDRKALAELGHQLGKKALEEMATVAKPNTILAWHCTFAAQQGDRSQFHKSIGRPLIDKESKTSWCGWPARIAPGAMTASWELWPTWDTRSATRA